MTPTQYLKDTLASQTLENDGDELKLLRERRDAVEQFLRDKYGSRPSIRYGGSKAKGTMIKDSFDIDLTCYFDNDDTTAGDTLQEIYESVEETLRDDYYIERKSSAVRLKCKDSDYIEDYHIDVVPGRFVDDDRDDVFLYRHSAEKGRQKTNLQVHIDHVKKSGVIDAIRLTKLWRVRNRMTVRNFILELLTIQLLEGHKSNELTAQLIHVWTELRDNIEDLTVEDPANPYGNDLSELFNATVRLELSEGARIALINVENDNWEAIFGGLPASKTAHAAASAAVVVGAASRRTYAPRPSFGSDE